MTKIIFLIFLLLFVMFISGVTVAVAIMISEEDKPNTAPRWK